MSENKKIILGTLAAVAFLWLSIYALGAWVQWHPNPGAWSENARCSTAIVGGFVLYIAVFAVVAIVATIEKKNPWATKRRSQPADRVKPMRTR